MKKYWRNYEELMRFLSAMKAFINHIISPCDGKTRIANNVPPPAANAPKNVSKWLNKISPLTARYQGGQRADFI